MSVIEQITEDDDQTEYERSKEVADFAQAKGWSPHETMNVLGRCISEIMLMCLEQADGPIGRMTPDQYLAFRNEWQVLAGCALRSIPDDMVPPEVLQLRLRLRAKVEPKGPTCH